MVGSPEFQAVVECCRRNLQNSQPMPLPAQIDWAKFCKLVRFHRIEGLVHNALRGERCVPRQLAVGLQEAANSIAALNLRTAAACGSLSEGFNSAGIPVLFVKGLTLGTLAYATPTIKSAVDVDILIDPADLSQSAVILEAAGFRLIAPSRLLHRWHRTWKESIWRQNDGLQLDLHTRLVDNPLWLPSVDVHAAKQSVRVVGDIVLPTLANEPLFAYLSVHGASSSWFRLKWISDFAAFLSTQSPGSVARCYEASKKVGAGRAAGQALLLADALFQSLDASPELQRQLRAEPALSRSFRRALKLIKQGPPEPTERLLGTWPLHVNQLLLQPGVHLKLAHLTQQAAQILTRLRINYGIGRAGAAQLP